MTDWTLWLLSDLLTDRRLLRIPLVAMENAKLQHSLAVMQRESCKGSEKANAGGIVYDAKWAKRTSRELQLSGKMTGHLLCLNLPPIFFSSARTKNPCFTHLYRFFPHILYTYFFHAGLESLLLLVSDSGNLHHARSSFLTTQQILYWLFQVK